MAASESSLHSPSTSKSGPSASAEPANHDTKEELYVLESVPDRKYVTGFKLYIIVAAVAFVSFLMLLDNMIVSTVGGIFQNKS
jgi:maltodextrin utilization protein YvdJ